MTLISGTWATVEDVLAVTGVTVTSDVLTQAQGVIDIVSNMSVDQAVDLRISARDLRWLGMALCYQAAWQSNQVDVITRTDVTGVTQEGMQFSPANDTALILSPLAKRCLDRISWRRPRSIRLQRKSYQFTTQEELAHGYLRDDPLFEGGWQSG